jgi:hypothetical protein
MKIGYHWGALTAWQRLASRSALGPTAFSFAVRSEARLVLLMDEKPTLQGPAGLKSCPTPATGWIRIVVTLPRKLHKGHAVPFAEAVVDPGADGDELEFAEALSAEREMRPLDKVEIIDIPHLCLDQPPSASKRRHCFLRPTGFPSRILTQCCPSALNAWFWVDAATLPWTARELRKRVTSGAPISAGCRWPWKNVPADTSDVGLLGAAAAVTEAVGLPHAVEELGRARGGWRGVPARRVARETFEGTGCARSSGAPWRQKNSFPREIDASVAERIRSALNVWGNCGANPLARGRRLGRCAGHPDGSIMAEEPNPGDGRARHVLACLAAVQHATHGCHCLDHHSMTVPRHRPSSSTLSACSRRGYEPT